MLIKHDLTPGFYNLYLGDNDPTCLRTIAGEQR